MPALTPAVCRDGIAAVLNGITGIGQVHKQRRRLRTEQEVAELMKSNPSGDNVIRAWFISPAMSSTVLTERHPGHVGLGVANVQSNDMVTLQWSIEGYLSVVDASLSEQVAADLVWTICDTFNKYGVIPGMGGAVVHQLPTNCEEFKYAMLAGSFLCHYVRLNTGFIGRYRP